MELANKKSEKIFKSILALAGIFSVAVGLMLYPKETLIALIPVIAILTFAIWPVFGLAVVLLLFPFHYIEFVRGDINLPIVDIAAIVLFISWILRNAWIYFFDKARFEKIKWPAFAAFGAFVLASFLSVINSNDVFLSVKYIFRPIIFFYLMFLIVPINIIKKENHLKAILGIAAITGTIVSVIGIASLFVQDLARGIPRIIPISVFGVFPMGTNHNLIAEALIGIIPLSMIFAILTENPIIKKIVIMCNIIMIAVALGTLSRAGWISLIVFALIWGTVKYGKNIQKYIKSYLILFILLLPLIFLMWQLITSDISTSANENRIILTQIALDAWKEHPIIGNGAGSFVGMVQDNVRYIAKFGEALDSHGFIQKTLAESGIIGLITFAIFIISLLKIFINIYNRHTDEKTKTIFLLAIMVFIMGITFQLFNTSYYISRLWLPVGIALSTMFVLNKPYEKQ